MKKLLIVPVATIALAFVVLGTAPQAHASLIPELPQCTVAVDPNNLVPPVYSATCEPYYVNGIKVLNAIRIE